MRATNNDKLGTLITAATTWRNNALAQGVNLDEINTRFPGGKPVTLRWVRETEQVFDDATQTYDDIIIYEGWDVSTEQFPEWTDYPS